MKGQGEDYNKLKSLLNYPLILPIYLLDTRSTFWHTICVKSVHLKKVDYHD